MTKTRNTILALVAVLLSPVAANAVLIDTFDTNQVFQSAGFPSVVIADEAIGGEREGLFNSLGSGSSDSIVSDGALNLRIVNTSGGSFVTNQNMTQLFYDGIDGPGWNTSNSFDLTDGGISDRFLIEGFIDLGFWLIGDVQNPALAQTSIVASIYGVDAPVDRSSVTLRTNLPEALSFPAMVSFQYELLFEDLVPSAGYDVIDVSDVSAISFFFGGTGTALRLGFDTICTGNAGGCVSLDTEPPVSVPEPGTLALLGIGLAAMGLARRKKV